MRKNKVCFRAQVRKTMKKQYFCGVKIADYIRNLFSSGANHTLFYGSSFIPDYSITHHPFGESIYMNIVEILTDLYAEVLWSDTARINPAKFDAWKAFVDVHGHRLLVQLLTRPTGFAVIAYGEQNGSWYFREMNSSEYTVTTTNDQRVVVKALNTAQLYYVLKSPTLEAIGKSDWQLCKPYIDMLDAVINCATTTAERLGAYVVMTPDGSGTFGGVITEDDKKRIEKEMQETYGGLRKQQQIMILPKPMKSQVVSLAAVDVRFKEKALMAVLAICDRVKVPANQVAIVDANGSKSLSNGTELREGDTAKYRSFRRLLNATLFDFASEIGLQVNYTLENEPKTVQGQTIEQQ